MRHVFIVNPMAGKRDSVQKLLSRIREVYPQGGYEVYATQAAGDAHRLAMEAIEGGEPVRLYACGERRRRLSHRRRYQRARGHGE